MLNPFQKSKIKVSSPYKNFEKPTCDAVTLYEKLTGNKVGTKRTGKAILVLCPIHEEKHPSFAIYPDTKSFYCFACGFSGDIYKFVMELEKVDFRQALEIIKGI